MLYILDYSLLIVNKTNTKKMKVKIFFILIGLIPMCELMAQDYKKDWTEGKLTWEDFIERRGGQNSSKLKYFLEYHTGNK